MRMRSTSMPEESRLFGEASNRNFFRNLTRLIRFLKLCVVQDKMHVL